MSAKFGLSFRPKACLRCGGDAYFSRGDDLEWRCLQCGRVVPERTALVRLDKDAVAGEVVAAGSVKQAA